MRALSFWIMIAIYGMLGAVAACHAHEVEVDECAWYGGVAGMIASAKNGGASATELVPQLMTLITSCSTNGTCPVKDGQDTKRVLDFVRQTFELDTKGQPIDADAVEAHILGECIKRAPNAMKKSQPAEPMTPDSNVPFSGPQIES